MVYGLPRAVRQQLLLVVDHRGAGGRNGVELLGQLDGVAGAGLLAHAAVDAAQHVDLKGLRTLVPVIPGRLLGDDVDTDGRADGLAHEAGDAFLPSEVIDLQPVFAAETRPHLFALLGVLDGKGLMPPELEDVQQGVEEPFCYSRQVEQEAPAAVFLLCHLVLIFSHLIRFRSAGLRRLRSPRYSGAPGE